MCYIKHISFVDFHYALFTPTKWKKKQKQQVTTKKASTKKKKREEKYLEPKEGEKLITFLTYFTKNIIFIAYLEQQDAKTGISAYIHMCNKMYM